MSWARIDDNFHAHPKVVATSLEALGLWVIALSYTAAYELDGKLPRKALDHLVSRPKRAKKLAEELVDRGLWIRIPTGFAFHEYLERNPAAADIKARRKAAVERVQRWRKRHGVNALVNALVTPPPSRPVPRSIKGFAKSRTPGPVDIPGAASTRAMLKQKGL